MSHPGVPPAELMDFLHRYLNSVAELEGLLLAHGDPAVSWTAATLAGRLYVSERAALDVLGSLHRQVLLARDGDAFRFEPSNAALRQEVDRLAVWYARALIEITRVIHGKPGAAVRGFADAFRLREDK
jgi:hypothetical protein